jgi:hypothetical protein
MTLSSSTHTRIFGTLLALIALSATPASCAQDRDRYQDRDRSTDRSRDSERGSIARLDPGTTIPVRVSQSIDVQKEDSRVYTGTVDQDVRGDRGRIVIPRGSHVEMMVRFARDNDLNLDLESVIINGQRYGIRSENKHMESRRDNSVVGQIVGAINGGEAQGSTVRIPRESVVTFRLAQPLEMGVPDRGEDRGGYHYHDYDRDRDSNDRR